MSNSDFIWLKGRARFIGVDWARPEDSNKLTEENKESEEPSVYKSATDGRIPLSFKGRHLLQRLRTSTMAAIHFTDWHVFGEALSRSRAAIARRMGELESELRGAKAQTTAYRLGAVEQLKYITKLEAERYTHCEELHQRIQKLERELQLSRAVVVLYSKSRSYLKDEIAKRDETIQGNENFIELQAQRLRARLDQVEQVAKIVNTPAMIGALDP